MGIFDKIDRLLNSKTEERPRQRPGRNELCWCGSGKKYKQCHLPADEKQQASACSLNCGPT